MKAHTYYIIFGRPPFSPWRRHWRADSVAAAWAAAAWAAAWAGMFAEALEQMEYCYELTDDNESLMVRDSAEEVTLHHDVCVHLHRVYTKLARSAADRDTSVDYYLKAYNRAREGTHGRINRDYYIKGGSVAEWLACWTQAQKGPGSNRSRDAVG